MNLINSPQIDWTNITYLLKGTPIQRLAYNILIKSGILNHLKDYSPTLVGTIPLDIDIPGSDLDILCEAQDFAPFANILQANYGHLTGFYQNTKTLNGVVSHISRFIFQKFPFEIVAQPVPVRNQRAFRHMLAEARLLEQGGEPARIAIRKLKLSGLKTEPAFGQHFGLKGDPYQVLLDFAQNNP